MKFNSNHPFMAYFIGPISIGGLLLILFVLFLEFNIFGKAILLLIITLLLRFIYKNSIFSIEFLDDKIKVKSLRYRLILFDYEGVSSFRENVEGFLMYKIIRVNFKHKTKFWKNRAYFYCPPSKRKELDDFLKEKGFIIQKMK